MSFKKNDRVLHKPTGYLGTVTRLIGTNEALVQWDNGANLRHEIRFLEHIYPQPEETRSTSASGAEKGVQADSESVNHPAHYGGDTTYEVIKAITAWGLGFDLGNVTKYVARAGKKDPTKELEDLRKARFYLDHRINQLEQI